MTARTARRAAAALAMVCAVALAGCTVSTDESDVRPIDSDIAELLTPSATPTPSEAAPLTRTLLTWVKGRTYVRTSRLIPASTRQEQLDLILVELVVTGLRPGEAERGLESALPPGLEVEGTVRGDRVVLDVPNDSQFEQGGVEAAVGQLAVTALSLPRVVSVRFTIDGVRTVIPVPDDRRPQRVVTLADYRTVLRG